jgi:hypothetical protein
MHDRSSYDAPSTTKIMALLMTSMLSLLITLHQQVRGRSTISQLSHDVSG